MATLEWNAFQSDVISGGDGIWEINGENFSTTSLQPATFTNGDAVIFTDLPGVVTLADDVLVSGLNFLQNGYSVVTTDNTLTFTPDAVIFTNNSVTVDIGAAIAGTNNIRAQGSITLLGDNTITGSLTMFTGTLTIAGSHLGEIKTLTGTTSNLHITGAMSGDITLGANGFMTVTGLMTGTTKWAATSPGIATTLSVLDTGTVMGKLVGDNNVNTLTINAGGSVTGEVRLGKGADVMTVRGDLDGNVRLGKGDDVFDASIATTVDGAILGQQGNDVIRGSADDNLIRGGTGNDTLFGVEGTNRIEGGEGRDAIEGGSGDDLIIGGAGNDNLTGGTGRDVFVFTDVSEMTLTGNSERIEDFTQGEDTIRLRAIDADTGTGGDQNFTFIGDAKFSGTAGELRAVTGNGQTIIRGDVDGDRGSDFTLTLTGEITLTGADFIF